jgi:hypothetical protein
VTSYVVAVFESVNVVGFVYALRINAIVAKKLAASKALRSKFNVTRTLIFNVMILIPLLMISFGSIFTVAGVDKQMFFYQYMFSPCACATNFFFILSTLSLSLIWIEMIQRIDLNGSSVFRNSSVYRAILYGTACVFTAGSVFFIIVLQSGPFFSLFAVASLVVTGISYCIAGSVVSVHFRSIEPTPSTSLAINSALQLSRNITILVFGMSFLWVVVGLTITTRTPIYKYQNSMPMMLQGQLPVFLVRARLCM